VLEALPWEDDAFDVVTGFSAFQFADDKPRALAEAGPVARGPVAVVPGLLEAALAAAGLAIQDD
jgi:ubiquinone/menaquinone biosynthesis C-methylase UbiE